MTHEPRRRGPPRAALASIAPLVIAASLASLAPFARAAPPAAAVAGPDPTQGAVIVLVGEAGREAALTEVLTELLRRQKIDVRFSREPRLPTAELLADAGGERAVWMFVELRGEHEAGLYFRGPAARRYLFRRLELPDGLDEVGRELIGQVAESSIASLLRPPGSEGLTSEGLTRDQMRATVERERERERERARRAEAELRSPATPATAVMTPGPRWSGELGARYSFGWDGPDLGLAHGPGLEVAVRRSTSPAWGMRVSIERWFTQFVPTTNIDAEVQTWPARLSFVVAWTLGRRHTLAAGAGGGVDVTRVAPGAVYDPTVAATAPIWHLGPKLRAEVGYELALGSFRLVAALFGDASIYDTHYDVDRGGLAERAATPWRVRPGGTLTLAWSPGGEAKSE